MMNKNEVSNKVMHIITDLLSNEDTKLINEEVELFELGVDSAVFIQIVIEIESLFDITIPDELLQMSSMGTVKKIVDVILQIINVE